MSNSTTRPTVPWGRSPNCARRAPTSNGVESEVLENDDGEVTGTFCHYRAESEEAIHEHADRAGLPATNVSRQGDPLAGE